MWDSLKLTAVAAVAALAALAAHFARDGAYQLHAVLIMCIAGGMFLHMLRRIDEPPAPIQTGYFDSVIRAGVIATMF